MGRKCGNCAHSLQNLHHTAPIVAFPCPVLLSFTYLASTILTMGKLSGIPYDYSSKLRYSAKASTLSPIHTHLASSAVCITPSQKEQTLG